MRASATLRSTVGIFLLTGTALLLGGCPQTDGDTGEDFTPVAAAGDPLSAAQKRRAEQITSIFENDTLDLQYAYMEDINDGRGYTGGRAGFTSATGDLLLVVERYTASRPNNDLAQYLPRLRTLAANDDPSTDGLDGLPQAWEKAADDAAFRAVQDTIVDEEYYLPAVELGREIDLQAALSYAALYDAIIQHGGGDDHDGLPAMINRATKIAGGSPADGVAEADWLRAFLDVRRATLLYATDEATREAWADGADRVDPFVTLLDDGNFNLDGPIEIETRDHQAVIP